MSEQRPEHGEREDEAESADLPPVIVAGGLRLPPLGVTFD